MIEAGRPSGRFPFLYSGGAVARFDRFDAIFKRLFQDSLADSPDHESEQPSLEILALSYHDGVHVGPSIRPPREGVGVARGPSPDVRIGGGHDDPVGIGPVVVQALPDAARALGDVGLLGTLAMHLQIFIRASAKELRAARSEVGEAR